MKSPDNITLITSVVSYDSQKRPIESTETIDVIGYVDLFSTAKRLNKQDGVTNKIKGKVFITKKTEVDKVLNIPTSLIHLNKAYPVLFYNNGILGIEIHI